MTDNELIPFVGKILRIDIKELGLPLYGKLIEVCPFWIISKARIMGIEPVRDQQC